MFRRGFRLRQRQICQRVSILSRIPKSGRFATNERKITAFMPSGQIMRTSLKNPYKSNNAIQKRFISRSCVSEILDINYSFWSGCFKLATFTCCCRGFIGICLGMCYIICEGCHWMHVQYEQYGQYLCEKPERDFDSLQNVFQN